MSQTLEEESSYIIKQACDKYEKIGVAFNGGKESLIVSHMCLPEKESFTWFYIMTDFEQMDGFVNKSAYDLGIELVIFNCDMKEALNLLIDEYKLEGVIMGTRKSDPYSSELCHLSPTQNDWPYIIRILPILNWEYNDVWVYIDKNNISMSELYTKQGYTSIGDKNKTFPNFRLFNMKGWSHPRLLEDGDKWERVGRITKGCLPVKLHGVVIHGYGRGKDLGFPTANIDMGKDKLDIQDGVYSGIAYFDDSDIIYKQVCSIGTNTTFEECIESTIEVHIINGLLEDFYDKILYVEITKFIRPMLKFDNIDELVEAIKKDICISKTGN